MPANLDGVVTLVDDEECEVGDLEVSRGERVEKYLVDENHHLVPLLLRRPPGPVPVVHAVDPAVASDCEPGQLRDDLRLLVQQSHAVGEEDHLLVQGQQIPHVLDQHDGYEGLTAACPEVNNYIVFLGLLQQLNLNKTTVKRTKNG